MNRYLLFLAVVVVGCLGFFGLQGRVSKDTPVQVFDDMDLQARYRPQGENRFFADGRDARPPVAGTVARGDDLAPEKVFSADYRRAESLNPSFVTGKDAKGAHLAAFPSKSLEILPGGALAPFKVDAALLETGRQKYGVYCAVCHGAAGDGNGIMKARSAVEGDVAIATIANLHTPLFRGYPHGQIYDVITNGKNTMQGYGDKLSPAERWAVVAYLRALQLSQACPPGDAPASVKSQTK
jgi:mono/diheme cytochrome c family protein